MRPCRVGATGRNPPAGGGAAQAPQVGSGRRPQQRTLAVSTTQQQQVQQQAMEEPVEAIQQQLRAARSQDPAPATPVEGTAEQPVPGKQQCSGGALSLAGSGGAEQAVPRTLPQALATFFSHPSPLIILAGLAALLYWRAQSPLHPAADATVVVCVAVGWCLQEWVVHAALLHSSFDWMGRRIHVGHHQRPYYHVSIDDPPIVLAFMGASLALFWGGFGGSELAITAAISYFTMGLLYEYTHFIVHTRYLPTSTLGKRVRMHHLLHHTKNEAYWLAFTMPQVDQLFGTSPQPSAVRMSDMARASLKSAKSRA